MSGLMLLFNYIKERVWQKLQGWECKLLSQVSKEVLIKNSLTTSTLVAASPKTLSVLDLDSFPISCISLSSFVLPAGVYYFPPFLLTSCLLPLSPYILFSKWGSNHYHLTKFHAIPPSPKILRNYHVF